MDDERRLRNVEDRLSRLEERQQADREARGLAHADIDRRLSRMNELREQINSEHGRYVTRDFYDERHGHLAAELANVDDRLGGIEAAGRANRRAVATMIAVGTLAIGFVVAIVDHIIG